MTSAWIILLALLWPLPIGSDHKVRRRPWVTYGLVAVNVAVYLATQPDRITGGDIIFAQFGVVPAQVNIASLFTSLFIHMSIWHLFLNMAYLCVFGPLVEDAIGPVTFLVLYFGGGVTAELMNAAIVVLCAEHSHSADVQNLLTQPLVGASGAISAVLAVYAVRYYRAKIHLLWLPAYLLRKSGGTLELPAVVALAAWVIQNLAGGIRGIIEPASGGIAYWAHIGGFLFGFVTAVLTGLFRDGWQEYLLQDARAAAPQAAKGTGDAIAKYRGFLQIDPRNASVRVELASALAAAGRADGNPAMLAEAEAEMLTAVRDLYAASNLVGAVRACAGAARAGVTLRLTPRERLRLAGAARDTGNDAVALLLLNAIIADSPDSAEDEMARLKLAQMLAPVDRPRASELLAGFLKKYPESDWIHMVRELVSQVQSST
jgi:membrane associated rhomboid family serine protease